MKVSKTTSVLVALFPLLLLFYASTFFLLPFLMPLLVAFLVGLIGVIATALLVIHMLKYYSHSVLIMFTIIIMTWLTWLCFPVTELGILTKFHLEHRAYEVEFEQTKGGAMPLCLKTRKCLSDGYTPPILVFPNSGFLNAWSGMVRMPEVNQIPNSDRLKVFAADGVCDPKPLAPHYYICNFY